MPLLHVHTTPGTLDDGSRPSFVEEVTTAALRAESVPDTPLHRLRCMVFLVEAPEGTVYAGGSAVDGLVDSAFVDFYVSDGVLDPVRRERFAADVQAAVLAVHGERESAVVTSVVFHEVREGRWGRDGRVERLPQLAAVAGFEHLAAIARP